MNNLLNINRLEGSAPAALTHSPSMTLVKPSYGFVDTTTIVEQFASHGWNVARAQQAKVKNEERQGYQKHLLRFRNEDYSRIQGLKSYNESIPELIVENSHDGSSSLKIFFGVFRIACLNGIIAGSSLNNFRVIHSKNAVNNLNNSIDSMTAGIPDLIKKVEHFSTLELDSNQRFELSERAAKLRLANTLNVERIAVDHLSRPRRLDDVNQDAYSIFNVIQEKVIRGGIQYTQLNPKTEMLESKKTRAISSVAQSVKLNRELWNILEEVTA
jgi:hypothetical protein